VETLFMKSVITFLCVVCAFAAVAQHRLYGTASTTMYSRQLDETSALMTDAMGQPVYPQQKYKWEGEVYFPNNYTYATITVPSGKKYRNIRAKINLVDGSLLFTDSSNAEFVAVLPVLKIEFEDILNQSIITFIKVKEDTSNTLYQQLDSGKISLLKKIYLTYKDQMGYGTTNVTRIFEQKHSYFTYSNAQLILLNRSKATIMKILADKSHELEAYMEKEKIKLRKEEDLINIFHFYNSLK
jgi:hypothetical protein